MKVRMKVKDGSVGKLRRVAKLVQALERARDITREYFPRSNAEGRRRVMLAILRCVYEYEVSFDYAEELLGKCVKAVDKAFKYKSDDIGRRIMSLALFNNEWTQQKRH